MMLEVPPPPELEQSRFFEWLCFYFMFNTVGLPVLLFLYCHPTHRPIVSKILRLASQPRIPTEHHKNLVDKALSLPSSRAYYLNDIYTEKKGVPENNMNEFYRSKNGSSSSSSGINNNKALEYQLAEGYCSIATKRCVLRSIPGFPADSLPPWSRSAPSTAIKFAEDLSSCHRGQSEDCNGDHQQQQQQQEQFHNNEYHCKSEVVYGSEGFDAFRRALEKINEQPEKYRLAVNFLRSSLFGFTKPKWLPSSWFLSLLGGHFSPVLGYLKEEQLVAVFDVNHKYGFYLVDVRRLYDAVNTVDVMTGVTRGLVVTEIFHHHKHQQQSPPMKNRNYLSAQ